MIKNNFFTIASIAAFTIAGATGCKKTFLEVDPQGQVTETQALKDPTAADKVVGGVYTSLYFGGFDRTTVGFLWAIANDIASDDADKGSSPGDTGSDKDQLDAFTFSASSAWVMLFLARSTFIVFRIGIRILYL